MRKSRMVERVLWLGVSLLAAYQVAVGIEGKATIAMIGYTAAFGVLMVAGMLAIILGNDAFDSPLVVILAAIIPLGLALAMISEHQEKCIMPAMAAAGFGFLGIAGSRKINSAVISTLILAVVHGLAGLVITILPVMDCVRGETNAGFLLVSLGGLFIGAGGIVLAAWRAGKPLFAPETVLRALPLLLLLTTAAFVAGFALV